MFARTRRLIKRHVHLFNIMSFVIGLMIIIPMTNLLFVLWVPESDIWMHIRTYLLFDYVKNTIVLVLSVAILSMILGFLSAYVVSRYDFKGRKLLSFMLVMPLSVPSFVLGYIYSDMTSLTGTFTRLMMSLGLSFQLSIQNMYGAILVFSFTLYPYVYLMTLAGLSRQSASYEENAIILGSDTWKTFFKVTVPLSRPQLVAGTLLVILETLNDYGLVQYFNVRVFSFAIFNAWFSLGDLVSAIRLALYLLVFVFVIIGMEQVLRGKRQYSIQARPKYSRRKRLSNRATIGVVLALLAVVSIGFLIPVGQLVWYTTISSVKFDTRLFHALMNSIVNALIAGVIILFFGLMMTNMARKKSSGMVKKIWLRISNLGYAIPGAVIAVAVHVLFVDLDRLLVPLYRTIGIEGRTLVLTMSAVTLVFAYILRFLSIGFNAMDSQYDRIGMKFTESATLLGSSRMETLLRIDLPLIYPGLVSAFILVFVDIIKELPLTLILRPTNYHALSTLIYVYARDERIQDSGLASLILILISAIFIYLLTHYRKGMFKDVY